jgi:hypothetical protein
VPSQSLEDFSENGGGNKRVPVQAVEVMDRLLDERGGPAERLHWDESELGP